MPPHSKQPTEHRRSPLVAEEWQLRILRGLYNEEPRPTVEQRKLLATQTGLDAKWIARWFKRVSNSASKSRQTGKVGCHPSRTAQSAPAMMAGTPQSIDGSNHVKSPSGNLAEPTTSGTGSVSPGVFSAPLDHTYPFSRSGGQVAPENGRSAIPYHGRLHSSGWELEHPNVAPDLQGNRGLERPLFYPYSHGTNPMALPRPHVDLVDSQLPLGGIATNGSAYLAASQALPPFRHGTSSPSSGPGIMDNNVKSRNNNTRTSPSPATSASPGPLQQQPPTRYVHVNLVSERSDPAYMELQLGTHDVGLSSRAQAVVVPDFVVAPTGLRLGPASEPPAPVPSMYWLLFETELDPAVGGEGDDVVSSRSSSRGMLEPHVTPTPISFFAKWEDMLALERRIRSSTQCETGTVEANSRGPCRGT